MAKIVDTSDEGVTVTFRLPQPLVSWIGRKSDETFRSRNKLAQMILQQAMDADAGVTEPKAQERA